MSKEQKAYIEGLRLRIRELETESVARKSGIYTKEFKELVVFVVSIAFPLGWTELPLMSPASVWHVRIGLALWAIPIGIAAHLGWKLISMKGKKILAWVPVILAVAIYAGIIWMAYRGFGERQVEDVKQSLYGSVIAAPSDKFAETVFTVTNGSPHMISFITNCGIHEIVGDDERAIQNLSIVDMSFRGQLGPNGDSRSRQCLQSFGEPISNIKNIQCADIDLWTEFSIDGHPGWKGKKSTRFVGIYVGDKFLWMPDSTNLADKHSYCEAIVKLPLQSSP